jgi:dephospho-CoA kinase
MKSGTGRILKLGITGGIGSGKTTVCKVFSVLGIPVFSADEEAKRILDNEREIQKKISEAAGKDLYISGSLDRKELARLIFNNRDLLEKVNGIIHPAVFEYFGDWVQMQDSPYVIMEAAILFESGAARMMDKIVTVVTPVEERIERLLRGNKFTREQITERIRNQIDDGERISQSDFVIFNSENDMIIPAVLGVHNEMLRLYNKN